MSYSFLRDRAEHTKQEESFLFALSVCFFISVFIAFIVISFLPFGLSVFIVISLLRNRLSVSIVTSISFLRNRLSVSIIISLLRYYIIVISLLRARLRAPGRRIGNGDSLYF